MNTIVLVSANRFCDPYPVYPIGVSYLKTYLKGKLPTDYKLYVLDSNMLNDEQLTTRIQELNPTFIAVSLRNVDGANSLNEGNFLDAYELVIRAIRKGTSAHLSIGGAGFSIFPKLFMDRLGADSGIVGEGEESLRQLIVSLTEGTSIDNIEGLILPGENAPRLQHTHYVHSIDVEFEDDLVDYYWKYSGMLNIQTKRGCPYKCIYCSYPVIDGHCVRTLDAERIVDNMARMKRDKGIDYFFFTDSVFNIAPTFNRIFAEQLVAANINIHWGAYFDPKFLDEDQLVLYKASGLTHIEFGTETLCDETLEAYGKQFTFDDVKYVSDLCVKHNVYYAHFLILGGYGETKQTLRTTMENSKQLSSTAFFPYVGMRIYPHTRLEEIARRDGTIAPDDNLFEPRYYITKDFDIEEARSLAKATGKAWIFPDDPRNELMDIMRIKRNKKGPLWEYLRMP